MMTGAFQPGNDNSPASVADYLTALDRRDRSIGAWEQFFEDWDALLCPVSMTTAFPHAPAGSPINVDGEDESYWSVAAHCALFNYSGHPAVTLPYSADENGLPSGVQLVGKRWGEAHLLGVAKTLTEVSGGFRVPPLAAT